MSNLENIRPNPNEHCIGEFDGKKRYIRFDLNAFAEMEKMYGSMEKANEVLQAGSMLEIRKVLWLGLIWDEAVLDEVTGEPIKYNITPYQVGSWLDTSNMKEVIGNLTRAINGSLPEDAEAPEEQKVVSLTKEALAAAGEEIDPN